MERTFDQINEKIRAGKAVVMTAGEFVAMAKEQGVDECAKKVDVVTTATFGAMCSSGAFLNFGHSEPPIRMADITLNDVSAYGGLAAVDTYIGATQPSKTLGIEYGGAHVIEDLIAGKAVTLHAESPGTDCYARKEITTKIRLKDMNQAYLYNPRNCYQNYSAATNSTDRIKYTYMGTLLPNCANVTYSTSGEYSPLLKDPELRTIGMGTKIFFCGADGYVLWEGTQAQNCVTRYEDGEKKYSGYTLAIAGDMKEMSTDYVRGATFEGYGCTLFVGIGIPIPVLDLDIARSLAVDNAHLYTDVTDYGVSTRSKKTFRRVSYAELRSGSIELGGHKVGTAPLSSLSKAIEIAKLLKAKVESGRFELNKPVMPLPKRPAMRPLEIREEE